MDVLGIVWGAVFVLIVAMVLSKGRHRSREILKAYKKEAGS